MKDNHASQRICLKTWPCFIVFWPKNKKKRDGLTRTGKTQTPRFIITYIHIFLKLQCVELFSYCIIAHGKFTQPKGGLGSMWRIVELVYTVGENSFVFISPVSCNDSYSVFSQPPGLYISTSSLSSPLKKKGHKPHPTQTVSPKINPPSPKAPFQTPLYPLLRVDTRMHIFLEIFFRKAKLFIAPIPDLFFFAPRKSSLTAAQLERPDIMADTFDKKIKCWRTHFSHHHHRRQNV